MLPREHAEHHVIRQCGFASLPLFYSRKEQNSLHSVDKDEREKIMNFFFLFFVHFRKNKRINQNIEI